MSGDPLMSEVSIEYFAQFLTPVAPPDIETMRLTFPDAPPSYLSWLSNVGWGSVDDALMLYSGPVEAADILGAAFSPQSVMLIGDDMAGYVIGIDRVDSSVVEIGPDRAIETRWPAFPDFIADWFSTRAPAAPGGALN